jgi:hypothetical protein
LNFFTPKLMKIGWSFLFFGSFATHFLIKLNTHGSNLQKKEKRTSGRGTWRE